MENLINEQWEIKGSIIRTSQSKIFICDLDQVNKDIIKPILALPDLLSALDNLIEGCLQKVDSSKISNELFRAAQAIKKLHSKNV